jgi:hypothetical protein
MRQTIRTMQNKIDRIIAEVDKTDAQEEPKD